MISDGRTIRTTGTGTDITNGRTVGLCLVVRSVVLSYAVGPYFPHSLVLDFADLTSSIREVNFLRWNGTVLIRGENPTVLYFKDFVMTGPTSVFRTSGPVDLKLFTLENPYLLWQGRIDTVSENGIPLLELTQAIAIGDLTISGYHFISAGRILVNSNRTVTLTGGSEFIDCTMDDPLEGIPGTIVLENVTITDPSNWNNRRISMSII